MAPCVPLEVDDIGDLPYRSVMSVEAVFLSRNTDAGFRELDSVVLLSAATTDDGYTIPAGTPGTVVGVWTHGMDCIVEFAEPDGAWASVPASALMRAVPTVSR